MRTIFGFLIGIVLIAIMGVVLFLSGAIFDATGSIRITPYVMQPNNRTDQRIGAPLAADALGDKFVRERLIRKFVYEYFYVLPDVENIAQRTLGNSVMAAMATPAVFENWKNTVAANIEQMAAKKMMRTVVVADEILKQPNSDYWEVYYELNTWDKPNDMTLVPIVETGIMYLKTHSWELTPEQILGQVPPRDKIRSGDINTYLKRGGDPAAIFNFVVEEIR